MVGRSPTPPKSPFKRSVKIAGRTEVAPGFLGHRFLGENSEGQKLFFIMHLGKGWEGEGVCLCVCVPARMCVHVCVCQVGESTCVARVGPKMVLGKGRKAFIGSCGTRR